MAGLVADGRIIANRAQCAPSRRLGMPQCVHIALLGSVTLWEKLLMSSFFSHREESASYKQNYGVAIPGQILADRSAMTLPVHKAHARWPEPELALTRAA